MNLIVDSGSTKTAWYVAPYGFVIHTMGINPVRDDERAMRDVVREAWSAIRAECTIGRAASLASSLEVGAVYFYGAGCLPAFTPPLERVLHEVFATATTIAVESDLLGAARALCGVEEGIVCILGTGSNSCLYDGERIVANTSPLGWILGDEGSGAVLGKTLVADLLKGQLPSALKAAFFERFQLSQAAIIERIYRQPMPNRFLASLVPFIVDNRSDEGIHALLITAFRAFFRRNVAAYHRGDLSVGFVGGIAAQFEEELHEAAQLEGFKVGKIEKQPILRMAAFHGEM